VRTAFTKNGGSMAEPGSVAFQFIRKGVIRVEASGEDVLLTVLDAGAEDAVEEDTGLTVYTEQKDLSKVRKALIDAGLTVKEAELQYVANAPVEISDSEVARKVLKLLDALDDLDDVVNVHTNADIIARTG
jgi:transcriptional/translational regulatory protein YebC/TACO1